MTRSREHGRTARVLVGTALSLALSLGAHAAQADDDASSLFGSGVLALSDGRPGDAIVAFEALADRGVVDPNASFDRGLAYATRVRIGAEVPGDLGRAAHGFAEARDLTLDPKLATEATAALTTVRAEVARRRARAGEPVELDQGLSLGRVIVELLPENAWAAIAFVASVMLGLGLFVRRAAGPPPAEDEGRAGEAAAPLPRARRQERVGATLVCAIAAPLLVAAAALAAAARSERLHLVEGIVVAAQARPADENGIALSSGTPIPEAARVQIVGEKPGWVHVERAGLSAWVPSQSVRSLARTD